MPDWLHTLLLYGTLLLFIGIFIGLVVWLFGSGSRRG